MSQVSLRRAVSDELVRRGFERADRLLRYRIDREFSWVVDTGAPDRGADISPYLGIRHERASRLFAELIELRDSGFVATGGTNLGYVLGGGFRIWNPTAEPSAVLAAIEQGQSILGTYLKLERLPEIYDLPGAKEPGYHFKLVAIYMLLGNVARVTEWLAEGERTDCRVQDAVCDQFRRFARNAQVKMRDLDQ